MEAELAALVTAGATTLMQQMVTDGWERTRGRVAAFLARRRAAADGSAETLPEESARTLPDDTVHALEGELERTREDLVDARESGDEDGVRDVEAALRTRLRRLLREDPARAAELRVLVDELRREVGQGGVGEVHNVISGGVQHGTVIQAGVVSGLTLHAAPEGRARG
ncbi:hypothetical protein [Streptomyces sp. NPDC003077]|uniref:hypothetical protein n=1 Tax=Streptomyces sp. NPDC003077 TaxID=3154443 RepID=UPI0033B46C4D